MIVDLDPLFTGEFHVIEYEPFLRCGKPNVIDEAVDEYLTGGFGFLGAELQSGNK